MKKKFDSKLKAALFGGTRGVARHGMLPVGIIALIAATYPVPVAYAAAEGQGVLPQGTFEQPANNGQPAGWTIQSPAGTTLGGDDKNHWVQLRDEAVMMHALKLSPEWKKLTVSARLKLSNYQKGPEGWHGPRVQLRFLDAKNEMVGDYQTPPEIAGNTDWVTKEVSMDIPAGATQLKIEPGLWGSKGLLEIDDIIVTATPPTPAPAAPQSAAPGVNALPGNKTTSGTNIGTKIGSWGVGFADGWNTFGWSGNPEKGTNGVRSWSGSDTTFTGAGGWFSSTWTPGNGNWIPDIGRGTASGPLNKMVENYNVQWNGTGIIIPNNSSYTFGLKFNLAAAKADGTSPGWKEYDMTTSYEAYIVTHTNKVAEENRKFIGTVTTPGDPVPYDCYTAEGYWGDKANGSDGKFIQLYAFRKENTWNGPVNVQAILKFWEEKSGTSFKMSTWHMSTGITIAPETFDTAGAFRLENIRIPNLDTLLPLPEATR